MPISRDLTCSTALVVLGGRLSRCAQVGGSRSAFEVARENGLDQGAEDNLRSRSLRKSHPEDKDELESVVES